MPSLHLPRRHQRHPSVDSRMHYATKALYTVDGALKDDSELQIIHDSIVTADLSDEEDEQRFTQELYRTALKEANKSTYYQQRANNDASVAIRTQLNEQRLRKQLHSLQSEWAQQANNKRRTEKQQTQHPVSTEPSPAAVLSPSNSRKSRRRHHGQEFVVLKGQDLARLQSISAREPTNGKQNEYYSFHDDYMMERERERQRREEEERNKNRWVVDDMDVVQPYDNYKFNNSSTEQLPQELLQQQYPVQQQLFYQTQQQQPQQVVQVQHAQQPQQYNQIPPEQLFLPIPPPALSHSPVSLRSDQSLFYNSHSNTNSTHSLSMPPPLTSHEDASSSSSSSGSSSSPDTDHHSDGGFLFTDQYADCEEDGESVLPPDTNQQTHIAESKPVLNPPNQHISASAAAKSEDSSATKELVTITDGSASSSLPKNDLSDKSSISGIVGSQPSVDHPNLPPYFSKSSDTIVSSLEKQASTILKPSVDSSSSSSPPPSLLSSSPSFVTAYDETSTIKPHSHRRGNYAPSKMSTDSKISAFSAKGIYDRFSKKKTSTPRVQSSLASSQVSYRQTAPSIKSHAMPQSTPSYREPYARSTASTIKPRSRQPQPQTNYPQSVYTVGTDNRSLNSYKSRKGELHVPIPLNDGAGYARSYHTTKAVPVETPRPEPQNRFAAAAAAATAAPAPVSSQQQAADYGEKFYDAWQSTKQGFQDWATAKYNTIYGAPEQLPVQPPVQPLQTRSSPANSIKIPITGVALADYPSSVFSSAPGAGDELQYDTYSIIDRSRPASPVLPDSGASLRSAPGTLRHVEDVDMIPTSLSSSVDAHAYNLNNVGNGSQRTGLMRKPVSPRGGLDPASREKLLTGLRTFARIFRQLARMSFILRPIDALADMAPGLEAAVIVLELIIMMWLLYELSIVLEVVTAVIKRVCSPAIVLGRMIGFGFK